MRIGTVTTKNPYFLAPMAGITDWPFRVLCVEQGAGLVYTEMVNARALHHRDPETLRIAQTHEMERPCAVQIFGHEPDMIAEAVRYFCSRPDICLIDINMGCPTPKIIKNGDGSALLCKPDLVREILRGAVQAALQAAVQDAGQNVGNAPLRAEVPDLRQNVGNAPLRAEEPDAGQNAGKAMVQAAGQRAGAKPITVKIRKGWDSSCANYMEIGKIAEEAGVSAITLHGRTREQMYSGKADWDSIRSLKASLSIPVIGNGDVKSLGDADRMMSETGCDAVMIGRGAQGNPWVFHGASWNEITSEMRLTTILRHHDMMVEYKGVYTAMLEMRKHIAWYLHGLKDAGHIRAEVYRAEDAETVKGILIRGLKQE